MNETHWQWCTAKPIKTRTTDELLAFVCNVEDCPIYRFFSVYAFLNLIDHLYGWDIRAPGLVWKIVMGDIPPPDQGHWGDLGLVWLPDDPVAFLHSRGVRNAST